MLINGQAHDPGSAVQIEAALHVHDDEYQLNLSDGRNYQGHIHDLSISDRLGNIARKLTLSNGTVFVTQDNKLVDQWLNQYSTRQSTIVSLIHRLESHMGWVAVALLCIVISSVSFFKWGLPWIGEKVAHALPHKANEVISVHTLDFLDDYFFAETQLDQNIRQKIDKRFMQELLPFTDRHAEVDYQLHFRAWGEEDEGIPNAFALPSGDIILTDRFVELSENQDQIDAVLFHEIAHVEFRHTLEMVVEGALLTTIVMMATGDGSGLADMGVGLGSLLVSSHYSRGNESEADDYAFNKMLAAGIDPIAFAQIMQRITTIKDESQPDIDKSKKQP